MRNTIILSTTLILSACVTPYHKAGADKSDWDRDFYYCKSKNRTADPAMMLVDLQNTYECMEMEKGWSK